MNRRKGSNMSAKTAHVYFEIRQAIYCSEIILKFICDPQCI